MFRNVLRNFQRILTLQPTGRVATTVTTIRTLSAPGSKVSLFHIEKPSNAGKILDADDDDDFDNKPVTNVESNFSNTQTDYIVPYSADEEREQSLAVLLEALRTRFRLTPTNVKRLLGEDVATRRYRLRPLVRTMELLCLEGVTKTTFIECPWLLTLDKKRLQDKIAFLRSLPMKDINHFAPFLRLTVPRLRKLAHSMRNESDIVPYGNRVYYISEMLHTEPSHVTKYISKRLFILEMPFEMLEQNLHHMLNYQVSPQNILKDLWAFRYTPKSVQLRLERAKRAKKIKIMPWMVRCPESILQRSLKLSLDELAVLGDRKSVVEYMADRLDFDIAMAKAIMAKHPAVQRVRVTKIKEVLDYLLDEAGFTRYDIANVPRILCHSLETTKQRLQELESYGCRPTSLVILCRSKREYDKFVKAWLEMDMKRRKRKQNNTTEAI